MGVQLISHKTSKRYVDKKQLVFKIQIIKYIFNLYILKTRKTHRTVSNNSCVVQAWVCIIYQIPVGLVRVRVDDEPDDPRTYMNAQRTDTIHTRVVYDYRSMYSITIFGGIKTGRHVVSYAIITHVRRSPAGVRVCSVYCVCI